MTLLRSRRSTGARLQSVRARRFPPQPPEPLAFFAGELLALALAVAGQLKLARLAWKLSLPGRSRPLGRELPLVRRLLAAPGLGRPHRRHRAVRRLPAALEGSALMALLGSRTAAPAQSLYDEGVFLARARALNRQISG